jgi:hypothetical protein
MYKGLAMDAAPIPTPATMRNDMKNAKDGASAVPKAESKKHTAETRSILCRPRVSPQSPATAVPSTQPASAELAAQPVAAGLSEK